MGGFVNGFFYFGVFRLPVSTLQRGGAADIFCVPGASDPSSTVNNVK
jgi:hypothetical protein